MSGFDGRLLTNIQLAMDMVTRVAQSKLPAMPSLKEFKPKMNLPKLSSYKDKAPAGYWNSWPKRTFEQMLPTRSWVSSAKLKELALNYSYSDWARLEKVCERLDKGADIGCVGRARLPTVSTNASSAFEFGDRVADGIAEMIENGLMVGPLDEEEIPWEDITISALMVKLKPNGKARLIINLSKPDNETGPTGVNAGISADNFEAKMFSTKKFIISLFRVGKGALITKSDWNSAYKHQMVREEDLKLQFVKFLGKYFCELALIFGSVSSPGIYDDLAKVVLGLALLMSGYPPELVSQHLDDVVAVGPEWNRGIWNFDSAYHEVCEYVGVSLADRSDKDKSFSPTTKGQVLGVDYDTENFSWTIRDDKMARIVHMLKEAIDAETVSVEHMLSLRGKLINYMFLVPGGKYRIGYVIKSVDSKMSKSEQLPLSADCKEQLFWWFVMLQTCAGWTPIQYPDLVTSPLALQGYTDAAGGTPNKIGHGVGGILEPDVWFYIPWPAWLNKGMPNSDNIKFDRKMSVLELLGPLALLTCAPDRVRNKHLEIHVDNQGAVSIYAKGYSTSCPYCYTLAVAIFEISTALNCHVTLSKIRRCSNTGTVIADMLSKAAFQEFYQLMPERRTEPAWIPRELLLWIQDPKEDMKLGKRIMIEMSKYTQLIGYNC